MTCKLSNSLRMIAVHKVDGIRDQLRRAADELDLAILSLGLSYAENSHAFAKARQLYCVGKRADLVVDVNWLKSVPKQLEHKD